MTDFFNEVFYCYQKFVEFLFLYEPPGVAISYGYLILAAIVLILVVSYILRSIR